MTDATDVTDDWGCLRVPPNSLVEQTSVSLVTDAEPVDTTGMESNHTEDGMTTTIAVGTRVENIHTLARGIVTAVNGESITVQAYIDGENHVVNPDCFRVIA